MSEAPLRRSAVVALEPVHDDVRAAVRRALAAIDFRTVLPAGVPVALKVNLGWDLFVPGSITSPQVVEALVHELRDHVGPLCIVEADQVLEDIERAARASGMLALCDRLGVRWINMTREPTVPVDAPQNRILKRIDVPRILTEARLVTVPVMKTHAKTVLSGALKNQWGCLPTMRHAYHPVLDDAIADLNHVLRPALALMDGTVGLEGNGPKSGRPRIADRILCSTDPVALDTIQAIVMGLDPRRVPHLVRAAERGIGTCDRERIEVRGLVPERSVVRFRPARHNAVSRLETVLRASVLRRVVFDTPMFRACLVGAKLYYRAWTALVAPRVWRPVLDHPVYGPVWRGREPGRRT
jgi:uncharacterized protein (DUF362 family)